MNTPKSTPEENNELTLDMLEASMKESEAFKETDPEKLADGLFEKYPIKFKGEIVERIKKVVLQHKRLVLIIGENTLLAQSIATCIYTLNSTIYDPGWFIFQNMKEKEYVFERSKFKEQSYVGWDYAEIKEHLFKSQETLINRYWDGDTLFLRGIHSKGILERLCNREGCHGVLIVGVTNANGLPADLLSQFEVIRLEPEKQSETVGISQDRAGKDFVPFPTPSGTQWHEVKISFIDNENVKISAREITETKHYAEMGFRKGKTCKPVKSWNTLLRFSEEGCLKYSQKIKSKIEKEIQDLRKRLKAYFGIQDDPIILEHGYRPKFKVSKIESQSRSVHTFSNSDFLEAKEED